MHQILFVFGTRPEVIKLAPVIMEFANRSGKFKITLCNTGQQRELSHQALSYFNLKSDVDIDVMESNQTLVGLQSKIMPALQKIIDTEKYNAVIAQGDTMTVFCAAQISFYNKIPFFHVEAGLRSYNFEHPFPEEMIRQCASRMANLHFAPTEQSRQNLIKENIPETDIHVTGNTVVDALEYLSKQPFNWSESPLKDIDNSKPIVLVTAHRRENHGERLVNILKAVKELADKFTQTNFILPVHPNPNVKSKVENALSGVDNISLVPSLDYTSLVNVMKKATLILTDSGGIQEEGPSFGVPILVLRDHTERMEGVEAGCAKLVGADTDLIFKEAASVLEKQPSYSKDIKANPYGDGMASVRILSAIEEFFDENINS